MAIMAFKLYYMLLDFEAWKYISLFSQLVSVYGQTPIIIWFS